jgi:hypothetical protein
MVACCSDWNGTLQESVERSRPHIEVRALYQGAACIRQLVAHDEQMTPEVATGVRTAADLLQASALTLGTPVADETDTRNAQIRAIHRRRPMWESPEEWDHGCHDTCQDDSHPHGKVIGYICDHCQEWDEAAQAVVHQSWPCKTMRAMDGPAPPELAYMLSLIAGTALGRHVDRTTGMTFWALAQDAMRLRNQVAWLHFRYGLYEPADQCGCDKDDEQAWEANHFEGDDGAHLCRLGTVLYVCYTCRDEEGERVPWQCDTAGAAGLLDDSITSRYEPRQGDPFETWLRRQRDRHPENSATWAAVGELMHAYRVNADAAIPLAAGTQGAR